MGFFSSILQAIPGLMAPKPTSALTVTDTDEPRTATNATVDAIDVNEVDIAASISPAAPTVVISEEDIEMALTSLSPDSVPTTPPSTSSWRTFQPFVFGAMPVDPTTPTPGVAMEEPRTQSSSSTYATTTPRRPFKRHQDTDLSVTSVATGSNSTADMEAAIMAMDIDKDENCKDDADHATVASTLTTKSPTEEYLLVQSRMFDVPEIVRSIAEFLDTSSLAACCRVSRMWEIHCRPLMWRHVADKHWNNGGFCTAIKAHSHYVRTVRCENYTDYDEVLSCDFPRLNALSFHGSREPVHIKEKILEKVKGTLTSLVLRAIANTLTIETTQAIQGLGRLKTLKLVNVAVRHEHLQDIIRQCENLEFLTLSKVDLHYDEAQIMKELNMQVQQNSPVDISRIYAATNQTPITSQIKYLAIKDVEVPSYYLTLLIRQCPGLLELSLARNESLTLCTDFLQAIKETCPRLYAIDFGSCKQLDGQILRSLFSAIKQLTVINLSGTLITDEELSFLADECKSIRRLDIQHCTMITPNGLHQYLSKCGPALRHLEASGVTLDPRTFDQQAWTCSNLQILFVHVGLVGSYMPLYTGQMMSSHEDTTTAVDSGTSKETTTSTTTTTNTAMTVDVTGNERKRSNDIRNTLTTRHDDSGTKTDELDSNEPATLASTEAGISTSTDVEMQPHPLHPLQNVCDVQYLGLMGFGPKLGPATPNKLIQAFRSVKRLHLLGMYQFFKKEDLEWLIENLPELCRIDAEKYNISDDLLNWFTETYPNIRVCRQE
ncbi:hypothetical protein BG011_007095 [Mortierella polycephala]|uniref:F-box/LRR-repeat protein 15-like leucin rich repeat domain-containing protein n=1 Tax=Mortierella polycephala TaxID=41804 RepID=A0A9P6PT99_9FUNG|nr:hypothetical protein BG011_007095 [Mortierella polycephala]